MAGAKRSRTFRGMVISNDAVWQDRHLIVKQARGARNTNYVMRCRAPRCTQSIWRPWWLKRDGLCQKHHSSARTLFGEQIYSTAVWNYRGQIYGIEKDKRGERLYVYKCWTLTCKNIKRSVLSNFLKRKGCRSCLSETRRSTVNELAFRALRRRAFKASLRCTLTQPQFDRLALVRNCFYCSAIIRRESWAKLSELRQAPPYFIDRIDNRRGYTWENSVVCCKPCNRVKNAWHNAAHLMALQSFVGWESELLLLVRQMKPDRARRLAAKHRRSGG